MTQRRRLIQAALGLAGSSLAGLPLPARASAAAPRPKVLRCAVPHRRDRASTRRRSPTSIRAPSRRRSSTRRCSSNSWPGRTACAPNTLAELPEVSADFRTFTFRVRPGIYFADDPAFKGRRRELVAEDYVYALKRHYDPRWKSNNLYQLESARAARPVASCGAS